MDLEDWSWSHSQQGQILCHTNPDEDVPQWFKWTKQQKNPAQVLKPGETVFLKHIKELHLPLLIVLNSNGLGFLLFCYCSLPGKKY